MRPVPEKAKQFLRHHEALRLTAYRDIGGVWTVGYGHTGGVLPTARITREQADEFLDHDCDEAARRLAHRLTGEAVESLTEDEYAALICWAFNTPDGDWTLFRRVNAGDLATVPDELRRWVYVKKERVQGLVNRREAEIELWKGEPI